MKKSLWFMLLTVGLAVTAGVVIGDDDEHEYRQRGWWSESRLDVAPVDNPLYRDECGGCHMAYQPGLLPARSWDKMMNTLDNHFGENAELGAPEQEEIRQYLLENAADRSDYKRSAGISRSLDTTDAPLRISDTLYFKRKHHEIPQRFVKDNPKVGSFSQCNACHRNADKGSYDEHEVVIPGVGRWDD